MPNLIPVEVITNKILFIRSKRVMLDTDLAVLYGVGTKRLNEQVVRNKKRFPEDFMFQLTEEEAGLLRSHFATSSWGGARRRSHAFQAIRQLMLAPEEQKRKIGFHT